MKLNGAQIIIETLLEQGVDTVFGYPGGAVLDIYDALYQSQDQLRHIITCHEQGAAHAADGYARASGKTGVVIATSGPGATNLVTGIATAYLDSTPLVAITGNVARPLMGKDSFQEVDVLGITMPITKHNFVVRDVSNLAKIVREAFEIANSGRPGPVVIDVPKDIQTAKCNFSRQPAAVSKAEHKIAPRELEHALSVIESSERPLIYAGGGVVISNAAAELIEFAEIIDAPIGTSMMGLSAIPSDYPGNLGMTGMHGRVAACKAKAESDLIIAVGARFSDRAVGNTREFTKGRKFLHIDIDPAEINKNIPSYASLVGDVKQVLGLLAKRLKKTARPAWQKRIKEIKNHPDPHLQMDPGKLNPQMIIEAVRKFTGGKAVIATDVGQHQMWVSQYYQFSTPRTFITSGGLGTMGFGMGAAIGACTASGKRTVLFTGDGSFHMNMNELATAVANRLPLIVIVMNNNALGMVRQWQALFFERRYSNTTLNRKTDFVKFAEAMGARGCRVEAKEELGAALKQGFGLETPFLIDAVIDSDEKVLPMIPPGGTVADIIIKA